MSAICVQWDRHSVSPEVPATGFVMKSVVEPVYDCALFRFSSSGLSERDPKPVEIKRPHRLEGIRLK